MSGQTKRVELEKRALRQEMLAMRRALPDQAARSTRVWSYVRGIPAVRFARSVMVFDSVPGEPYSASFIDWCRSTGKTVVYPDDEMTVDPASIDAVIVPGVAFTASGDRLGQGGGWYDRFLSRVRPDCITVGVGFAPQLLDELPIEPHDVRLAMVVTDAGVATGADTDVGVATAADTTARASRTR